MIDNTQLRECIIKPALSAMQLYSDAAVELLIFTCAVESKGGTYLHQIKGPALGIYQMEPRTYNDIWQNYLRSQPTMLHILGANFDAYRMPSEDRMVYDLLFATAMARLHYLRIRKDLPDAKDIDGIWNYYKEFYNTHEGKSKKERSIKAYEEFITPR